jgi:hypothetical protein
VVAHVCNPTLGRRRHEDHEFKASLGYIERLCLKKNNKKKKIKNLKKCRK